MAEGLRALSAELEDINGEPPTNLLWWADEIDRAIADLRKGSSGDADRLAHLGSPHGDLG